MKIKRISDFMLIFNNLQTFIRNIQFNKSALKKGEVLCVVRLCSSGRHRLPTPLFFLRGKLL